MCHGHPRDHPCAHTSINWYYCPTANIDLDTGFETPCNNVSFAPPQRSTLDCPLQLCGFKDKGGNWLCCECKQGPNSLGWCTMPTRIMSQSLNSTSFGEQRLTTCDHGCCRDCVSLGTSESRVYRGRLTTVAPTQGPSPEMSLSDMRRGSTSRKGYGSSRTYRRPTYEIVGPYHTPERTMSQASIATPSTCSSSSSRDSYREYPVDLGYRPSKRGQTKNRVR